MCPFLPLPPDTSKYTNSDLSTETVGLKLRDEILSNSQEVSEAILELSTIPGLRRIRQMFPQVEDVSVASLYEVTFDREARKEALRALKDHDAVEFVQGPVKHNKRENST